MPKPNFTTPAQKIEQIIRVNHAGEYGAKVIYQGQLSSPTLRDPASINSLQHMMNQEQVHLDYFTKLMKERRINPTIFLPLWHIGGYLSGLISATCGFRAAMLITESVEEVIEKHYQEQIEYLKSSSGDEDLLKKITQFQLEEIEHKNEAVESGSRSVFLHLFWSRVVKRICKYAIHVSKAL